MPAVIDNERFRKLLRSYPVRAVELLYDLYAKSLCSIARSLTHDQDASEDIVQDAFLHVWTNREELSEHHERSIEYYLVRVVRNKSISYYKKKKQQNIEYERLLSSQHNSNESPLETDIIHTELIRQIRDVIASFPRTERECLLLKIDKAMTPDQIAQHQNVTKKAVERSLTSAHKRLRKWFNK